MWGGVLSFVVFSNCIRIVNCACAGYAILFNDASRQSA